MDEAEWLTCTDPQPMLEFLCEKASDRKLRLFAVACCRRVWNLLSDERSRLAVGVAERCADEEVSFEERDSANQAAGQAANDAIWATRHIELRDVVSPFSPIVTNRLATFATDHILNGSALNGSAFFAAKGGSVCAAYCKAASAGSESALDPELLAQVVLLSDVFGNPFRTIVVEPAWRTPTVTALATAAYEDRHLPAGTLDLDRLAVLADALEEAGCTDEQLLVHLRESSPHVRGCWVIDLLLGKE